MRDYVLLTQNTMSATVATRTLLARYPDRFAAVVIATQFKGESVWQRARAAWRLIRRCSPVFLFYKGVESKLYNFLLAAHRILRTRAYQSGRAVSIEEECGNRGIHVIYADNLSGPEFLGEMERLRPKFVLCQCAQILRPVAFEKLGKIYVNAHGSLLPKMRGAAQYVWNLIERDTHFGVTVHFMEPGLDSGEILFQQAFPIPPRASAYEVHYAMSVAFGEMLAEFIRKVDDGKLPEPRVQDEAGVTTTRLPTNGDMLRLRQAGRRLLRARDFFSCY